MPFVIKVEGLSELQKMFRNAPKVVGGELEAATKAAAARVVAIEKGEVPVRTGTLRRSIGMAYTPITAVIEPKVKYGQYLQFGTGIYGVSGKPIRPRTAKALRFVINGKVFYRKSVKGMRANPFVTRTVAIAQPEVISIFMRCWYRIIEKL